MLCFPGDSAIWRKLDRHICFCKTKVTYTDRSLDVSDHLKPFLAPEGMRYLAYVSQLTRETDVGFRTSIPQCEKIYGGFVGEEGGTHGDNTSTRMLACQCTHTHTHTQKHCIMVSVLQGLWVSSL